MEAVEIINEITKAIENNVVVFPETTKSAIEEFADQVVSLEYYPNDGDLNLYDEDEEIVLALRVKFDNDDIAYICGVRDR